MDYETVVAALNAAGLRRAMDTCPRECVRQFADYLQDGDDPAAKFMSFREGWLAQQGQSAPNAAADAQEASAEMNAADAIAAEPPAQEPPQ